MHKIIAIAVFACFITFAASVQAQTIFLKKKGAPYKNSGESLFIPQGNQTSTNKNAPLFLDQEYGKKVGRASYNPYQGEKRKFFYGQTKKDTMSFDDQVTMSLLNSEMANFESAARENERIQAEAAAEVARVEERLRQQYSNDDALENTAGLTETDKAFYASLGIEPPAEEKEEEPQKKKKRVIKPYKPEGSGLSAPKPVFNSVR